MAMMALTPRGSAQAGLALRASHKWRNRAHTLLLAGGSVLLLAACAYVFAGWPGIVWAAALGASSLWMSARLSPDLVLRMFKARPMAEDEFPHGYRILRHLAARADLSAVPDLYYVPSKLMNAFAVGRRDNAAIAVTDALMRGLTPRQFAGVLAHEMSHIRNEDLKVMALADMVSRMTATMSTIGLVLLAFNLPALIAGGATVPWAGIGLLWAAPTIGALLQLALSRAREYDADLDAAALTGDPAGLASALRKLEKSQGRQWEMVLPGGRVPQPSVLRSHPKTSERVRRLEALAGAGDISGEFDGDGAVHPHGPVPIIPGPRYRLPGSGLWY